MKVLYLEAQKKLNEKESPINIDPKSFNEKQVFLAYSIQYKQLAEQIKKELEAKKVKIMGFQQVLGCTKLKTDYSILLIGSGRFHALNLALQNPVVYVYNGGTIAKIEEKDLSELKKNKEINLKRFVLAKNIGIIISTKPGQENLKKAKLFKEKITKKYPEKRVFFFVSNNINLNELENFSINFWINSACPGITNDSPKITNIDDITDFLQEN